MRDDVLWDQWWQELINLAPTDYIQEIIEESVSLYEEYYEMGWTPLQALEEEFG